VLLDGEVIKSCLMLAVQVHGRSITTIEGLAATTSCTPAEELHAVRRPACGYRTPGFIMASCDLLKNTPQPSCEEVPTLSGNSCAAPYTQIVESSVQHRRCIMEIEKP
jgi:carbon-monoxide dehydrogenase small subunit